MEIWKEIIETNNRYSISNLGRVKKNKEVFIRSNGRSQLFKEKIITPIYTNYGYLKVRCSIGTNKVKNIVIHRLVAKYFLDKTTIRNQVNHKNGIKTDNRVENLEWVTAKENIKHAWENNLSKPTNNLTLLINGIKYNSIFEASKSLNINRNTLSQAVKKGFYISRKTKVVYNGIEYNSLKEASRILGLNPKTIKKYSNSTKIEKYIIEKI